MAKMFRVLLTFYRSFYIPTGGISLFFTFTLWQEPGYSYAIFLLWMKILTNLVIGFLFSSLKNEGYYFYNNLGYSAVQIYVGVMLLDIFIWILMAITIFLTR